MWRLLFLMLAVTPALAEPLFEARPLTPAGEYTFGIEGPAVDADGNLYVVNFGRQGTIGKVAAGDTRSQLFAELPAGSIGVSIRFGRDRRMYVADYKRHNIFVFEPNGTIARLYFHSESFNQPNDMAIARDGTIYASDPNWRGRSGQVWRIVPAGAAGNGAVMAAERKLTTTNGIDLSPGREDALCRRIRDARDLGLPHRWSAARCAAPCEKVFRFQPRRNPHRHRRADLCRPHPEGHDRGADGGRQDRPRDRAQRQGADQPRVRRRRTARPSTSRSARAASSKRFASTGRAASSACCASRAIRRAGKSGAAEAAPRSHAIRPQRNRFCGTPARW